MMGAYFPMVPSAIFVTTVLQSEATIIVDIAKSSARAIASLQARAS
jgi:hypothetical protein